MDDMTGWDALLDRLQECNPAEVEWLTVSERSGANGETEVDALKIPDGATMDILQARLETLRQAAQDHALPGRTVFVFGVYGPKRAVRHFRRNVTVHKESALRAFDDPYEAPPTSPGNVANPPSVQTEAATLMREVVAFSKHMLGIMASAYQHLSVAQNSHTRNLARQVDEGLGREYGLVQQTLDNRQIEAAAKVAVANSTAAQQLGGQFMTQLKELAEAYMVGQSDLDPSLLPLAQHVQKDPKLKAVLTDPKMRELLGNDQFRAMFIDYLGGVLDAVQPDDPPPGDRPHAS